MTAEKRTLKDLLVMVVGEHDADQAKLVKKLGMLDGILVLPALRTGEDLVNTHYRFKADIVLVDVALTGMTGIEAARWIKEQRPETRIICLTRTYNTEILWAALLSGSEGCILKRTAWSSIPLFIQEKRKITPLFSHASDIEPVQFYQ